MDKMSKLQTKPKAPLSDDGHDHNFDSLGYGPYHSYEQEGEVGYRRLRNGVACFSSIFGSQQEE